MVPISERGRHIEQMEKVQRRATKLIRGYSKLSGVKVRVYRAPREAAVIVATVPRFSMFFRLH